MISWRARRAHLIGIGLALALAPMAAGSVARAEPTREDQAAAAALFDEGRQLLAGKKFAEACPKLEAAMRLAPGMGILFNLSDCYEQIGRTASAWAGFRDVASQARTTNQPEREKAARERVTALEPRLAKMRIVVPAELAGVTLTITRDGSPLPSALVGTPIPVDPGPHTLRVVAEGRAPWETKVTVGTPGSVVDVSVPALAPAGAEPAATGTAPAASGTASASGAPSVSGGAGVFVAPSSSADVGSPRAWQKPLGITAAIAGVAGLGAGIALGVVAKGTFDESNKGNCDATTQQCNAEGVKQRQSAVDQGNIGTVVGIAGAVIGAAGIVLWITAPSAATSAPAPAGPAKSASLKGGSVKNVQLGASPGGLLIRGQF